MFVAVKNFLLDLAYTVGGTRECTSFARKYWHNHHFYIHMTVFNDVFIKKIYWMDKKAQTWHSLSYSNLDQNFKVKNVLVLRLFWIKKMLLASTSKFIFVFSLFKSVTLKTRKLFNLNQYFCKIVIWIWNKNTTYCIKLLDVFIKYVTIQN